MSELAEISLSLKGQTILWDSCSFNVSITYLLNNYGCAIFLLKFQNVGKTIYDRIKNINTTYMAEISVNNKVRKGARRWS